MLSLVYRVAIIGLALAAATAKKEEDIKFEIRNFDTGSETGYEQPFQGLISTEPEWKRVWEWHKGPQIVNGLVNADGQVPKVDFQKSNILAIFMGSAKGIAGFEVAGYKDSDAKTGVKQITLRINPVMLNGGELLLTHPYALLEISKVKVPVEVQMSVGNNQWKTIGKFAPPKEDPLKSQTRSPQ